MRHFEILPSPASLLSNVLELEAGSSLIGTYYPQQYLSITYPTHREIKVRGTTSDRLGETNNISKTLFKLLHSIKTLNFAHIYE